MRAKPTKGQIEDAFEAVHDLASRILSDHFVGRTVDVTAHHLAHLFIELHLLMVRHGPVPWCWDPNGEVDDDVPPLASFYADEAKR
mgnify:CR=1 FL=1